MVKCGKCGYEWETKSSLVFVCCPSCMKKVRTKKLKDEEKD